MRQFFPALEKSIYLNTAYVGLLSQPLFAHRQKLEEAYLQNGDRFKIDAYERLEKDTLAVADFLDAPKANTFLVPNFSSGIRYFLSHLPAQSTILMLEEDYPSLMEAFKERDFKIDTLPIDEKVEQRVQEQLKQKTYDVLALSMVQYISGLLFDAAVLKAIKQQHPELLIVVDATQWMGSVSFSFRQAPIDLVVGSGYKWLLAGFNSGYACVSDLFYKKTATNPTVIWDQIFVGHFNFLGASSLAFAVKQLHAWDFTRLLTHKDQLAHHLKAGLEESGLIAPWVTQRKAHGSFFNFKGDTKIYDKLQQHGVRCSQRGSGIRVSVHFYNTFEEIDRFLSLL